MAMLLTGPGSAALQRAQGRLNAPSRRDAVLGRVGPAALIAALLIGTSAPDLLHRVSTPVAVGAILLGVPHGAVDHLVPFWIAGRRPRIRELVPALAGYLAIAALAAVAFVRLPDVAFAVFLVASVLHFGSAEVEFDAERSGVAATTRTHRWLTTLAHGMTVVLLPFAAWPDQVANALKPLAPGLGASGLHPVWTALGVVTGGLALAAVGLDLCTDRLRQAAELTLLVVAVLALPPLIGFAVYFGAWHALRHTGRLLALPGPDGSVLDTRAALRRFAAQAAGPTVLVIAAAVMLVAQGSASVLTVAVSVVLALTFPHMRTVAAWDRRVHRLR